MTAGEKEPLDSKAGGRSATEAVLLIVQRNRNESAAAN